MSEKYEFIDAEYIANIDTSGVDAPTVVQMCGWLSVSRSGYYEWLARPVSNTTKTARGPEDQDRRVVRRVRRDLWVPPDPRRASPRRRAGRARAGPPADA